MLNVAEFDCCVLCLTLTFMFSADWYKDRLSDKELDALENPTTPAPPKREPTKIVRRRKPARKQQKEEDDE